MIDADAAEWSRTTSSAPDHFRAVLGRGVHTGDALWRYRCGGKTPQCVLIPESVEEVSAAVRVAGDAALALVPCGNGTHLDVGAPPRRYDAALSSRALARVLEHDAGDMTVTVQGGITIARLNRLLAEHGQWLPFDPPRADEMTIGGLIAADRSGPLRLSCGRVRDRLIGIRAVTANGELLRGGGRVVKNVAGYDLCKLLVGSFGTLGIIVEATFKLAPHPGEERLFLWPAPSLESATARAAAILASPAAVTLIESVNMAAAEALGVGEEASVLVGCAGSGAELRAAESHLRSLDHGAALAACAPERAAGILQAVREFAPPASEGCFVARVSTLPRALPNLLARAEQEAEARALSVEIAAHAGTGVAWCVLPAAAPPQDVALYGEWLRAQTRERGGWAVFEGVPPSLRDAIDPWGFSGPDLVFMAGVKNALDPAGLLSPGRFVGGI